MEHLDTLVIGGGQAGLAMSRCLADLGVRHRVLERGDVAQRWRDARWESLRMLTPRWQSRLPGWRYTGADPHGFMSKRELVRYLEDYARSFDAPVETGVTVTALRRDGAGFRLETSKGTRRASHVVIATGWCDAPHVPEMARRLPADVRQLTPFAYRDPAELPEGGVLVVGASASGVQLAAEIARAGRPVTLAVGRHVRLPRRYRGADVLDWFDAAGIFTDRASGRRDLDAARRSPSYQLVGATDHATLDLAALRVLGVRLTGRLVAIEGARLRFADDLAESVAAAEARGRRVLDRIDRHIARAGLAAPAAEATPAVAAGDAPTTLDLAGEGIRTVLWATGYRRDFGWVHAPVLDAHGDVRHQECLTAVPGLYVLGMRFQSRRNSSFLDGVGADARDLARLIAARSVAHLRTAA